MDTEMIGLLGLAAQALCDYLERRLPELDADWWEELVVPSLAYQQQRTAERRGYTRLEQLDLAALLRVMDQNWHQLAPAADLDWEARNYLKETQTVRNRWAHAGVADAEPDDVYRDVDTLRRFCHAIDASTETLATIDRVKAELVNSATRQIQPEAAALSDATGPRCLFQIGQMVVLRSDPSTKGAVVQTLPGQPENRYSVFLDGSAQTYYESQLASAPEAETAMETVSLDEFHARLSALQIRNPSISTLYSLNAGQIDFEPYQYRPVLKFIRADRPRLLIADGVGVGKTIEAGLILRELQARREVRSVLIICPKALIAERKWDTEMRRFGERFSALNGEALRYCVRETDLDGAWPEKHSKTIVPYSLFDESLLAGTARKGGRRQRKGLLELDPPPHFDLVIVDEAHHVRNPGTYSHQCVRFFCENADAVLFLTATPIQLGNEDLFVLLNLLRPDLVIDHATFSHMAEPNPSISRASGLARAAQPGWQEAALEQLEQAAATDWGNAVTKRDPAFQTVVELLRAPDLTAEQRVKLIGDIEQLHTFSGILSRTRRRDIGEFAARKPFTVPVDFTPAQRRLHDDLLRVQSEILSRLHDNWSVRFMMTTLRRQAASCLFGLRPFLEDILTRRLDELALVEADGAYEEVDLSALDGILDEITSVVDQATRLPPSDPKLEALCKVLSEKQALAANKVMVFSSFRHTLAYLHKHLDGRDFRVGVIHGDVGDEERRQLRRAFSRPREEEDGLDILLFSDVGSEGLDYQFCDCIVNYDLPWNPMRVEQRIGRIDRRGQRSESVTIYNLITPDTVDADIYERCLWRIGVFEQSLGDSEEILGQIGREIRIVAEDFELTPEERQKRLSQMADNHLREVHEQQKLEEQQQELFGLRLPPEQFRKAVHDATSDWLSSAALENLVRQYLRTTCGDLELLVGGGSLKTLRLSQEARSRLLQDFSQLPRDLSVLFREWEKWLKGGEQRLAVTFESQCAQENPEATLLTPVHPLVKQAAAACSEGTPFATSLAVTDTSVPPGEYAFAVYHWQYHGIREDAVFQPVCLSEALSAQFARLLRNAVPAVGDPRVPTIEEIEALEQEHYTLWAAARDEHRARTEAQVAFRKESLATSHRARLSVLEDQLLQAHNDNIRRMREAQIAAAKADYGRRLDETERAALTADVTTAAVAYGCVHVRSTP